MTQPDKTERTVREPLRCPVEIKPCPYINGFSADNSDVTFVLQNYDSYSDFIVFTEGKPDRCFRFARAVLPVAMPEVERDA